MRVHAEWRSRAFFAEIAEVLGIDTTEVLAAHGFQKDDEEWTYVLFTPEKGKTDLWSVWLRRGQDGVLYEGSFREPQPGLWEKIEDTIDKAMKDGP